MGAEATERGMEDFSYQRDLLRRFSGTGGIEEVMQEVVGGGGGVELNLGLSLGGCFCEEPREKKLVRSSSVSTPPMLIEEHASFAVAVGPIITRACSLPTEAEEERRKRKEMQGLKRMEAKRRRSEKKEPSGRRGDVVGQAEAVVKGNYGGIKGFLGTDKVGPELTNGAVPIDLPSAMVEGGYSGRSRSFGVVSQGSIGSQGSSSSSVSDLESLPAKGFEFCGLGSCAEVKSALTLPSLLNHINHNATTSPTAAVGKPIKASNEKSNLPTKSAKTNVTKETERNVLEEMPQVHTCGDGPNGKRIEGFLYNYIRGEVRIVCVCHGHFLTPAEFVKHAGGSDITNPLRHIVVNTSPLAM